MWFIGILHSFERKHVAECLHQKEGLESGETYIDITPIGV